jgi:hypothetical protein
MADEMTIRGWWAEEITPFVREAMSLRFVHLETGILGVPKNVYTCTDLWLFDGHTFLDLVGNFVALRPVRGVAQGFAFAQFRTWKGDSGDLREVYTAAERTPPPRAPGVKALVTRYLLAPLIKRLSPEQFRAFPLCRPEDLRIAFDRHRSYVSRAPGAVFRPHGDPLEWRWSWQEQEEGGVRAGDHGV